MSDTPGPREVREMKEVREMPDTAVVETAPKSLLAYRTKPQLIIGVDNPVRRKTLIKAIEDKLGDSFKRFDLRIVKANELHEQLERGKVEKEGVEKEKPLFGIVIIDNPGNFRYNAPPEASDAFNAVKGRVREIRPYTNMVCERSKGSRQVAQAYIVLTDEKAEEGVKMVKKWCDGYFNGPDKSEKDKPSRFDKIADFVASKVKDGQFIPRSEGRSPAG